MQYTSKIRTTVSNLDTLRPYHLPARYEKWINFSFPEVKLWIPPNYSTMTDVTPYQKNQGNWVTYGMSSRFVYQHREILSRYQVVAWGPMRPVFLQPDKWRRDEAPGLLYR
jgi:hypothetical protein